MDVRGPLVTGGSASDPTTPLVTVGDVVSSPSCDVKTFADGADLNSYGPSSSSSLKVGFSSNYTQNSSKNIGLSHQTKQKAVRKLFYYVQSTRKM